MQDLAHISETCESIEAAARKLAYATKAWANLPLEDLSPERLEKLSQEILDLSQRLSAQVTVFNFRRPRL